MQRLRPRQQLKKNFILRAEYETKRIESKAITAKNSFMLGKNMSQFFILLKNAEKHIEVTKGGLVEKRVWNQTNM